MSAVKKRQYQRDMKITKLITFACTLHCLMMLPLLVGNFMGEKLNDSMRAILYATYLPHHVINIIIYALSYKPYRDAYVFFFMEVIV